MKGHVGLHRGGGLRATSFYNEMFQKIKRMTYSFFEIEQEIPKSASANRTELSRAESSGLFEMVAKKIKNKSFVLFSFYKK